MGHNGNPNSLKNLELGRWKPGQSGNPTGRAKGTVYPSELLHGLLAMDDDGTPKYTRGDLEKIVEDENAAPALVIAARWIIDGMRDGQRWVVGKDGKLQPAALDPTPSRVRESLADRLEGKPVQKLQVQSDQDSRTPKDWENEIVKLIESNPTILASVEIWATLLPRLAEGGDLIERLRPLLEVHAPGLLEQADAKIATWRRKVTNCAQGVVVKALPEATN
ncbi:MAG: DUF5681 domain-containing protein [Phycisphaerales bacterium]